MYFEAEKIIMTKQKLSHTIKTCLKRPLERERKEAIPIPAHDLLMEVQIV